METAGRGVTLTGVPSMHGVVTEPVPEQVSLAEMARVGRLAPALSDRFGETRGGMRWRTGFPGEVEQLGRVRQLVRCLLQQHPACGDAELCATELAGNAIRHTRSGRGGRFVVEVSLIGPYAGIAVADGGAASEPTLRTPDPERLREHGRGLLLVAGLSSAFGWEGGQDGHVVWAEFTGTRS